MLKTRIDEMAPRHLWWPLWSFGNMRSTMDLAAAGEGRFHDYNGWFTVKLHLTGALMRKEGTW